MAPVIEVKNLSKRYLLNHEGNAPGTTLVETLSGAAKRIVNRLCGSTPPSKSPKEEFWALNDVSFNIEEGDRVGIIGRNGAGKSTLLKILSQITEPTTGQVKMRGRLSSLLEVGTGFHPELTGKENIYLNGAILGMKRSEINSKFKEIVEFAEIENFLDTPVKRYSSGMYMRLGFAVAAHLEADIMIIDEVLAVGDAQFQAKCFKKLDHLGKNGRTVLFVSHDINSVLSLCNRGIYLENGAIKEAGSINTCVNAYMEQYRNRSLTWSGISGDEHIKIYGATLVSGKGVENQYFEKNDTPCVTIDYEILKPHPDLYFALGVWNKRNQLVARAQTYDDMENQNRFTQPGRRKIGFKLDASLFGSGDYHLKLYCAIHNVKEICHDVALRFPIYSDNDNTRFRHSLELDGVNLGNNWHWPAEE